MLTKLKPNQICCATHFWVTTQHRANRSNSLYLHLKVRM